MVKVRKTKPGYHWTFESQETLAEYVPTSPRLHRAIRGAGVESRKQNGPGWLSLLAAMPGMA